MADKLAELYAELSADTSKWTKGFRSAQKDLGDTGKAASGLDTRLVGLAAKWAGAFSVSAVVGYAVHVGETFDEAYRKISFATGATGERLHGLEEVFKNVYQNTAASSRQLAQALSVITQRTGQTGDALEGTTRKMLTLAKVAGTDVVAIAPLVTRVFGDWSIAVERQGYAMGVLGDVVQKTGVTLNALADRMVYFGAPLRQVGFDFEQAAVLIGRFEAEGVNTETVLRSLRFSLGAMLKSGQYDTKQAFGIIVSEIKNAKTEAAGLEKAFKAFGQRAAVDMYRSIKENRWDEFISGQAFVVSDSLKKAEAAGDSLGTKWTKLKHVSEVVFAPMGEIVVDFSAKFLDGINTDIKAIQTLIDKIGELNRARPFVPWQNISEAALMAAAAAYGVKPQKGGTPSPAPLPPRVPPPADNAESEKARKEREKALNAAKESLLNNEVEAIKLNKQLGLLNAEYKRGHIAASQMTEAQTTYWQKLGKAAEEALSEEKKQFKAHGDLMEAALGPVVKANFDAITEKHKELGKEMIVSRQAWADWSAVMIEGKAPLNDEQRLLVALTAAIDPVSESIMRMANEDRKLKEIIGPVNRDLEDTAVRVHELDRALSGMGVAAYASDFKEMADWVDTIGEAMERGEVSTTAYLKAWLKLIEAMRGEGADIDPAVLKEAEKLKIALNPVKEKVNEFERATRRAFDGMARGMAKSIVEWKGFGATLKSVAKDFAEGMLEAVIRGFLKPLEDAVAKVIGKIMGKLMDSIGLGSGGGSTSSAGGGASSGSGAGGGMGGADLVSAGLASFKAGFDIVSGIKYGSTEKNTQITAFNVSICSQRIAVSNTILGELNWKTQGIWTLMDSAVARLMEIRGLLGGGGVKAGSGGGATFVFNNPVFGTGMTPAAVQTMFNAAFRQAQLAGV